MLRMTLWSMLALSSLAATSAQAGWTPLNTGHQPPARMYGYMLLMDGRVLCNECDSGLMSTVRWWTLSPDANGSYVNGTWARVGDALWTHLYFASCITPDGRILIAGGEYSSGGFETNKCEIFDPITNTWSSVNPPTGWGNIGDAPCATMPDGRMILGDIFSNRVAIFDPFSNTWTAGPNKLNSRTTEETWVLLPDGTVGTWDCFGHPGSERYLPTTNQWINCGNTVGDLVLPNSYETGAGIVLPDGRLFAMGGPPRSGLYTCPPVVNQPGTWAAGPAPANINGFTVGQEDGPGALTPDGKVLLPLGRVSAGGGEFFSPTYFHEYNGTSIARITDPPGASGPPYVSRLTLLPTGEILWTSGNTSAYVYTNGGSANPAWKPAITDVETFLEKGASYPFYGTQLNGLSNGASYGDEYDPATNYPLVRVTGDSGAVTYLRTFNPSTRAIQTGATVTSSNFAVPSNLAAGSYGLRAVANGIASDAVTVNVMNAFQPSNGSLQRGQLVSGNLNNVKTSDNLYVTVKNVLAQGEPSIQVTVKASTTQLNASNLAISIEDAVTTTGVVRSIEVLNVQTGLFELLDSSGAATSDSVTVAGAAGNVTRFINQTTGVVTTRLTYTQTNSPVNYRAKFDRFALLTN